jgi:hypothetical protein
VTSRSRTALAVLLTLAAFLPVYHVGCTAVIPRPIEAKETGFSAAPVKVDGGYVISARLRDSYNALAATYGAKKLPNGAPVFLPPLKKDDRLTRTLDGNWFITNAGMEDFLVMKDMQRRGSAPN